MYFSLAHSIWAVVFGASCIRCVENTKTHHSPDLECARKWYTNALKNYKKDHQQPLQTIRHRIGRFLATRARFKTKVNRLAEVAKLHNAKYCVIILTKHEGEIFEKGTISIFEEYGKQSAQTRYTRERMTFDEHHRYADENYAKVTTNRLKKSFRALARTLQTRGLDILLRSLAQGRTVLKPPQSRNNAKPASEKSPASLSPLQSPRPASLGEKSRAISSAYMANMVGFLVHYFRKIMVKTISKKARKFFFKRIVVTLA